MNFDIELDQVEVKPEFRAEIETLNIAYDLFNNDYQGRIKWLDAPVKTKQEYFAKARQMLGLPDV